MVGHYDYLIVALSVLMGILGGYCTIELAGRVTASHGRDRFCWWLGGAIALGIGAWSMHYTGMLAFRLPIPIQYYWPTVVLSYLAILSCSLAGLFVVSGRKMDLIRMFAVSVFMGGGIVALHYISMESMRMPAMCHYSAPIVILSAVMAIGFSLLSLWLMFALREDIGVRWRKVGSSVLLGAAISVMHYTGMASASFTAMAAVPDLSHSVPISDLSLLGIGVVNVMILAVVMLASLADRLEKQQTLLRNFSRQVIEVQEAERRHLARELHDEIGQALTGAKINLQSIVGTASDATLLRLQETTAIIDRLLAQVRQISLNLRPSILDDLGLVPALRSLLDEQGRRASVAVHFSAASMPENLDPEIQTTCFRIAQEAITNAVRHANATKIDVDLRCENGKLRLQIRDNGIGFDVESVRARPVGLGLIGITERAALVDGHARVVSSLGKGTTIKVLFLLTIHGERASRRM
jgi:signal transduction histidine kinase